MSKRKATNVKIYFAFTLKMNVLAISTTVFKITVLPLLKSPRFIVHRQQKIELDIS